MTTKHPASVTQARQNRDAAWSEYMALADELDCYAVRNVTPPAGFYERLEHARVAALKSDIDYGAIYRAAEHKAARERELRAEAEINTDEAEPDADFDDLPELYELADEAVYELQDWLMQSYPNEN
jgi:hypothetical protein